MARTSLPSRRLPTRLARSALAATVLIGLAAAWGATSPAAEAARAIADQRAYIAPKLDEHGALRVGVLRADHDGANEQWSPAADAVIAIGAQTTVPAWTAEHPELAGALGPVGSPVWLADPLEVDPASVPTALIGFTRKLIARDANGDPLLATSGSGGTVHGVTSTATGARAIRFTTIREAVGAVPLSAAIELDSAAGTPDDLWSEGSGRTSVALTPTSWAFRAAGYYCLDVEIRATLVDGTRVTDREGIAVAVGADPLLAPVCEGPTGGPTEVRMTASPNASQVMIASGTEVAFTAEVSPPGTPGIVRFHDDDGRGGGEQPLGDPVTVDTATSSATLRTAALAPGRHTLRAEFTPDDPAFESSSATMDRVRIYDPGHFVLDVDAGEGVHADVAARTEGDDLALRLKVDGRGLTPDQWPAIDDSILVLTDRAKDVVPDPTELFDFGLVAPPGSDVWQIPLNSEPGIPWLGISSESIVDAAYQRYTAWRLEGVSGIDGGPAPGHFVLWTSAQGDKPFFSTRRGMPDAVRMLARSSGHWHASWTFTAPGIYCLNMSVSNRAAEDRAPVGDEGVLTVIVGEDRDPYLTESCSERGVGPRGAPAVAPSAGEGVHLLDSERSHPRRAFAALTPRIADGELHVDLVEGSNAGPGVAYDPEETIVRLGPSAVGTIGTSDAGAGSRVPWAGEDGQRIWEIEESSENHSRYNLGWNTLAIDPAQLEGDLTWELTGVEGPGEFVLHDEWSQRAGHALLSSRPGHEVQSHDLWPGRYDSGTWIFSEPGVYCVGMEWSGRLAGGAPVERAKTMTFLVGDADPAAVAPCADGDAEPDPGAFDHRPDSADPEPETVKPQPRSRSAKPGVIRLGSKPRRVLRRAARLLTIACPAGGAPCRVAAPRRVGVEIAGKRYAGLILGPRRLAAGERAALRLRLPAVAARRLWGRASAVEFGVTVAIGATRIERTVRIKLRGGGRPSGGHPFDRGDQCFGSPIGPAEISPSQAAIAQSTIACMASLEAPSRAWIERPSSTVL